LGLNTNIILAVYLIVELNSFARVSFPLEIVEIPLILFLEKIYIIYAAIDNMEPVLIRSVYKWSIIGTKS
jgi:hypothetical protein